MDKQGRVLLPAYLRESVGLTGEAVLVGTSDHAEIWAPDRWDSYRKALDDPQELASAFAGPGDLAPDHMRFQDPLGIRFVRDGGAMYEGHLPVLVDEVLEMLAPAPGSLHIDATLGGGGHAERILEAANPDGRLLGLDADALAIARVEARLRSRFGDRLVLRQANFRELADVAPEAGFGAVDGCLFDLGLSSYQLADRDRGFGFRAGGPLDMRFDTTRGVPAAELLASLDAAELTALFRRYGEEPKAPRIARAIVDARKVAPVATAEELAALVERVAPPEPAPPPPDPSGDPRLPGAPDRRQRGARGAPGGSRRRPRPPAPGRPARRPVLPLARGPDRQAVLPGRASRLRLPARRAGLRLRPEPAPAPRDPPVAHPDGRRDRRQPPRPKRPPAGRRATRRLSKPSTHHRKEEPRMSKRHQSSRRKAYGRRQHEVRERQRPRAARRGLRLRARRLGTGRQADPLGFLDPRSPRIRFALGD